MNQVETNYEFGTIGYEVERGAISPEVANPQNFILDPPEVKKIKGGVTRHMPVTDDDFKMLEYAAFMRDYCKRNLHACASISSTVYPICHCPFAAANHRKAQLGWCSIYGMPYQFNYFEDPNIEQGAEAMEEKR
jgi:hypothetical protein